MNPNKNNTWKYIIGLLCIACCAVPIWLIVTAGAFSLSFFTQRLDIVICTGVILAIAVFMFLKKKKKQHSNTCAIDCECGKGEQSK